MVHIRFTSLVLGLLFVTHAIGEFYALAHLGWEMIGNGFEIPRGDILCTNYHKEIPTIIGTDRNYLRKLELGGRKMAGHHLPSKKEVKNDELEEAASKKTTISGKDSRSEVKFPGASEHELLNIIQTHKLEAKGLKSAKLGSSKPRRKKVQFEGTKPKPTRGSLDDHEYPPQRLLDDEAKQDLVTLMHRDYNQPNRAHPKPPINNGVPKG